MRKNRASWRKLSLILQGKTLEKTVVELEGLRQKGESRGHPMLLAIN